MRKVTGAWAATGAALVMIMPLALTGCGGGDEPRTVNSSPAPAASPTPPPEPLTLAIGPAAGTTKQPVSTEISTKVSGGEITNVTLKASDGSTVGGSMRPDGSAWVPDSPLKYGKAYTASVTATNPSGKTETRTTAFATMSKPRSMIGSGLYLFNGKTYGVAMPVVAEFTPGIPKKDRATVQKRMFVTTNPPQPGTWHWVHNGTQAYYRAPQYWQPGTTISVRLGLEGIPLSNGRYGNTDRKATAKIGNRFELKVSNKTKKLSAYDNGKLVKTMPVSLGKRSTPSSSGTMVVMDKKQSTVFDTRDDPNPANRYVVDIEYAQRLTWGGEFIHSAPWSVRDQGRRNVSHGCVNVSAGNARWLFSRTKVGDPVTVSGTERKLEPGNGWTAWNMSWTEFVKGSALPLPAEPGGANATPAATPSR